MGIIARQSIKRSIISSLGVLIGMLSTIFIYPLATNAYGFVQFLISTSTLLALLLSFGSPGLVVKYFPEFKKDKGYLGIILSFAVTSILIFTGIVLIFKKEIFSFLSSMNFNVELLDKNLIIIFILAILLTFIQIMMYQSANFKRIVIPSIIHELGYKLLLPVLILLYYFHQINLTELSYAIVGFYIFSFVLNFIYVKTIGGISISDKSFLKLPKKKVNEMLTYMGFSGLNVLSANITTRIDTIMIPMLISTSANGIYTIFLFMSNTLAIPMNSLNQIASPVVSDSIKNSDYKNIDDIYKKTSINAFLAGAIIFIIVWTILKDIVAIMPKNHNFLPYLNVFLFLGIAKLVDMLTSVNSYIIIYSKYYKYNLLFLTILAAVNLILNYLLIGKYGIEGAAIATLISITLYNLLKLIFIKIKFGLFPFNKNTAILIISSTVVFIIGYFIPSSNLPILNLIYKPLILISIYYLLLKAMKIKADAITLAEDFILKHIKLK